MSRRGKILRKNILAILALTILLVPLLPFTRAGFNDTVTSYLSNTTVGACSPGPCRQLVATTGTADTTTKQTIPKNSAAANYLIKPDSTSSTTGTPSTTTPAGAGWVLNTDLNTGISAGTWTIDITVAASAAVDTANMWLTVWSCTSNSFTGCTFLFNIQDTSTNVLASTSATKYSYSSSQSFFSGVHYISIEFWLHVTATSHTAVTATETTNSAASDLIRPHVESVISYVGSATSTLITNATSGNTDNGLLTISYISSSQHFVDVTVVYGGRSNCAVLSVTDSGGSTYTKLVSVSGSESIDMWGTTGRGSIASTSFTITVSSDCNIAGSQPLQWTVIASVAEYAGAIDTLGTTNTNSGVQADSGSGVTSDCPQTGQQTSQRDRFVCGFTVVNPPTAPVAGSGSVRASLNGNNVGWVVVADNQGGDTQSPIDVSIVSHDTGSVVSWGCIGIELRTY